MITWTPRDCWIAVFDILGFKNMICRVDHEVSRGLLEDNLDELIEILNSDSANNGQIDYLIFSDTFVILAPDIEPKSYPWFLRVCKDLIVKSINIEMPLRGAVGVGPLFFSQHPPILLGEPFVDTYEYCEDQDWVGLLLTPSATSALRRNGLEPLHHGFVSDPQIPLRKKPTVGVVAYRFQNGSSNFPSPLLRKLNQMKHFAKESTEKCKYERTISFIQKHYTFIERK